MRRGVFRHTGFDEQRSHRHGATSGISLWHSRAPPLPRKPEAPEINSTESTASSDLFEQI